MIIAFILVCIYAYALTGFLIIQTLRDFVGYERFFYGAIWPAISLFAFYWWIRVGINKARKKRRQNKEKGHNSGRMAC